MVESHDEVTVRTTKWDFSFSTMDNVNATPLNHAEDGAVKQELDLAYTICEILVAICAVVGNALVILVFHRERRLRRRTNYYIVSLATADFLVGLLGIPFAILASVGLPHNLYACLFTVSLLVVLCTISIFCLVAVSVDRYWAILHPMGYSRNVRTKTAIGIIAVCWASGTLVGFLPLFGWYKDKLELDVDCYFTKVMDYDYLVFLYFATIVAPALLLAAFYAHIYQVVVKQLRQIVTMNPTGGGGTMLRVLGAAQKREVKATKNLSIIVLFFIVCWFPLYTINCVQAFCHECTIPPWLMNCCIILSHLNSAGNPLLYAYHLRDFRAALKNLLCCVAKDKNGAMSEFQGGRSLHHGLGTPSRNNSSQSLHHHQNLRVHHPHNLADSPSFASSKTFPNTANSLSTITSSMNSIAALSVGTVQIGDGSSQAPRKKMWTLTEVSSNCEDDQHLEEVQRRSETRRGSAGQVNSAYIEDGSVPLDFDYEDGDDDVFLSDGEDCDNVKKASRPVQMCTSMSIPKLSDTKTRTCVTDPGKTPDYEDTTKLRDRLSLRAVDELAEASLRILGGVPEDSMLVAVVKQRSTTVSSSNIREESNCPDTPSPPDKLLLVEAEINNREIDTVDDKIELSPSSGAKMFPVIVRSNSCNGKNSDRALAESELPRTSASSPTGGSLKLSPLKIVGGFFFHSGSVARKPNRLKEEASRNSSSVNDSGIPEQMEVKANGLQRHTTVTLVDTA